MAPSSDAGLPRHTISIDLDSDGTATCRLGGDIDVTNADAITARLREVHRRQPRVLKLDLRQVTFLDSAGVRIILQSYRRQQEDGNLMTIMPGEGSVSQLLQLSGIARLVQLERDPSA